MEKKRITIVQRTKTRATIKKSVKKSPSARTAGFKIKQKKASLHLKRNLGDVIRRLSRE